MRRGKRVALVTLYDAFLRTLVQNDEDAALDVLAHIGHTQGVETLHAVMVAAASVALEQQRSSSCTAEHIFTAVPPPGSPFTIDELPVGPRTGVRWLAAVGNQQPETARALFDVLRLDEHPPEDARLFMRTVVRTLCAAWSALGPCEHGPH
jgi:hypothetical protein